jgi:hypothetical protein
MKAGKLGTLFYELPGAAVLTWTVAGRRLKNYGVSSSVRANTMLRRHLEGL